MRTRSLALVSVVAAAALAVAATPASAKAPTVPQLVVFRAGNALDSVAVKARATHVRVGGRRCAVGAGTALAALAVSKPPKLKLRDYGSCGKRARDAVSLFVRGIGPDVNHGIDGWVYKSGNRLATAGAGDPSGPFGSGRLKSGTRVTWFYCHMNAANHSCQPTLRLSAQPADPGTMRVHVTAYDDRGHATPAGGSTVHAGAATTTADSNGDATLTLAAGTYLVHAERSGSIRSFDEALDVH
ncbi:MAG: hypothetical protein QOK25_1714 [Thermoleophilaceae bacterium]|nr:hypothetical protein [Thermoleophilaceae bacterium]